MLIRLTVSVMLMVREVEGTGFGFWPTAKEWAIGFRYFAFYLPIGLALSAGLRMIHFKVSWIALARAPFRFLAALWVIALFEEFLARGLLQRWISDWTGRPNAGLFVVVVRVLANLMAQFTEPCEGASDVCSAKRGPERMDKKRERQRGVVGTLGGALDLPPYGLLMEAFSVKADGRERLHRPIIRS